MTADAGPEAGPEAGQSSPPERDHPLAAVMAFLGGEIDHSAVMLRDLAACLSEVILALDEPGEVMDLRPGLSRAAQALQNEDRIQQRLSDLRRTLLVLEQALQAGAWSAAVDLDQAIVDQLRLDDMRDAYARSVGMPGHEMTAKAAPSAGPFAGPSAGDVDLF